MFDLSIEITTYNRKEVLRDVLQRLSTQSYPTSRFEVVLSDDGSTDGLQEMVAQMQPSLPFALRFLQHEHQGPGHAHNEGIHACSADIVLMLAADILPTPALVEEHLRSHREHPDRRIVIAGRLTQSPGLPDTVFQRAISTQVEMVFQSQFNNVEHGGFLVSNLSFKRDFMLEFGLFLEWPPASGEDLELGYRLGKAGMKIIESEAALGYHQHEETLATVARRAYMTGYNSHYFSEYVDEPWVRRRFGMAEPTAGLGAWVVALLRNGLRHLLINHVTAESLMLPMLRTAEKAPLIAPLTPILARRIAGYFFKRGIADFRSAKPFVFPDVRP